MLRKCSRNLSLSLRLVSNVHQSKGNVGYIMTKMSHGVCIISS